MKWLLVIISVLLLSVLMTGCASEKGAQGIKGIDGTPGTNVTVIQFCPQHGSTTHSHFPEKGICINGAIIAAFWDGTNAFLAEVVPGAYISTSTGLQCSFTVTSGCSIQ